MNKFFWIIDNGSEKAKSLHKHLLNLIPNDWTLDKDKSEYVFIIGGDGTFLRNKEDYLNKKIIAINGGNLGFYAYFKKNNLNTIIKKIENKYNYINPAKIELYCNDKTFWGLNEILIKSDKVLNAKIYVNGVLLENFKGSGLLFATPLGSTAHAKNVGGAIVSYDLDVMQMIEIEPLTQKRYSSLQAPIILEKSSILKIKIDDPDFKIIIDGQIVSNGLFNECTIKMKMSDFSLFKPNHKKEYFKKLRDSFVKD